MAAAQGRVKTGAKASPAEIREFMRAAVSRIVVYEKHFEIFVNKVAMRQALLNQTTIGESKKSAEVDRLSPKNLIRLLVQAQLMRCGGEVRLVLPAGSPEHNPERTVPALIKAIARAHDWYGRLVSGEVGDQRSIATLARLDERYVSRILLYAFLAPEIVEAILQGRHPPGLTLENVRSRIPIDWREQRELFGFPPGSLNWVQSADGGIRLNGFAAIEGS